MAFFETPSFVPALPGSSFQRDPSPGSRSRSLPALGAAGTPCGEALNLPLPFCLLQDW